MSIEVLITFLHNLAMSAWVGGLIFLFFWKKEVAKTGPSSGAIIAQAYAVFSKIAMLAIMVLILTGIILTLQHGGLARVQRDWVLNVKHGLIVLVLLNGSFLGFKASPAVARLAPKKGQKPSAEFLKWQRWLNQGSDLNLVLAILIVLFAVL